MSGTTGSDLQLAIVGSGIAGCAAADFARQQFTNIEIDVFEQQSRIGGRIRETAFASDTFETGATAFHDESRYMMKYVDRFNLELANPVKPRQKPTNAPMMGLSFGIWDGQRFLAKMSGALRDRLTILRKYGLSFPRLWWQSRRVFKQFNSLYDVLEAGGSFKSPDEMLARVDLYDTAQQSAMEHLREHAVSQACIHQVLDPISRTLYGQDARMSAVVDLYMFKAIASNSWYSIRERNSLLLDHLLDAASATIHMETKITAIDANTGSYTLTAAEPPTEYGPYDAVIIATPLEKTDIELNGGAPPVSSDREYQSMYINLVNGVLDPTYFELGAQDDLPDAISTTTDVDESFTSIVTLVRENGGTNIYHVTATSIVPNDLFLEVFSSIEDIERFSWEAYPVYEPPLLWPPFQLDHGIYYTNAMESAISSMETEVMGSRNVVNLLSRRLREG
ncbi:prenylcysteine lyase family protein [Halocatena halophila]|uniref:prenylcysteine lyase family protein n=1 Tax=Halocatena halophila TaxID=2814576 RepID=UPI002ED582B0